MSYPKDIDLLGDRVLLSEVKVFASSPSSTLQLNSFPAGKQIEQ
ncbi:hypothetical protein [Spirosoma fluviale]|uniref:Uncharacterized protein n=1 Tax=Spirosoma fluviale TaxID=1597977 RepID=A0A286G4X5_9BACT|nr:hypothetical protein [Spirosoma fluviale]SOD90532.1 hypothetical protein SAMN06269250_3452 [Spirosoma fluviale]